MMSELIKSGDYPLMVENSNQAHGFGPPRGLPTDQDWCDFNMFRSGGDIGPDFANVMSKLQTVINFTDADEPISRPGCWWVTRPFADPTMNPTLNPTRPDPTRTSNRAYPDMLEVGNFGLDTSPLPESASQAVREMRAHANELAVTESKTHFYAWCIVSSPLILGLDLLDSERVDSVWSIISNTEAIAVNQAWAG